jgi:pantetheine-phosphate adenylyltransferase
MIKAIYPGIFDPITKGHIDIIQRSSQLFESVEVVVGYNPKKKTLFSVEDRIELIAECIKGLPNVTVSSFHGLTVDYVRKHAAGVIIRGLRAVSDFEYEFQMALMNMKLNPECETIYLMPKENFTYLNSGVIKEIASLGGDVSEFVSKEVENALRAKFPDKK